MRYGKFMSIIAKDQSYNVLRIRFSCFQDDIKTNREESEISQETK